MEGEPTAAMRYDAAPDRRRRILEALSRDGFLSVRALAENLGVSDMTVRRDLRKLEEAGEVRVVHGGASLPHGTLRTPDFVGRAQRSAAAKRSLARTAARFMATGDTVAFDAGTTVYALAVEMAETAELAPACVVTHSVPVIQLLLGHARHRVVVLGGDLSPDSQAMVGPMSARAAADLRVRTFFMGVAAVDERGIYVEADLERPTKLALMDAADRVVVLADSAKFTRSAPVLLSSLERVDALVTDTPPPPAIAARLAELGKDLHVAPVAAEERPIPG
ncbi:DeoR/GlpR family DNA-binding transcription regulator [Streptomonospora sediminis]